MRNVDRSPNLTNFLIRLVLNQDLRRRFDANAKAELTNAGLSDEEMKELEQNELLTNFLIQLVTDKGVHDAWDANREKAMQDAGLSAEAQQAIKDGDTATVRDMLGPVQVGITPKPKPVRRPGPKNGGGKKGGAKKGGAKKGGGGKGGRKGR